MYNAHGKSRIQERKTEYIETHGAVIYQIIDEWLVVIIKPVVPTCIYHKTVANFELIVRINE